MRIFDSFKPIFRAVHFKIEQPPGPKKLMTMNHEQTIDLITPLMAMSNSPTRGHPKFPQAGRPDYDDSGVMAMRAAASLSR